VKYHPKVFLDTLIIKARMSQQNETPKDISDIKGIGPSLAERIKKTLDVDSIEDLASVSKEQLTEVKGIGSGKADKIYDQLQGFTETCERCGEKFLETDSCPGCIEELRNELDDAKRNIERLDEDIEGKKELHDTLEELESSMENGEIDQSFKLLNKFKDDLSDLEKEDIPKISDLDGVGPTYAERIKETLDVTTAKDLASFSREELTQVKGIGSGKADKILEQLEGYSKVCDRCEERFVGEETCPNCTEELEEELDLVKENLRSLKEDVDTEGDWNLDKRVREIESELEEGDFGKAIEILDFAKDELAAAEQLYIVVSDIENLLEKESGLINQHTYQAALRSMIRSLRHGNYHRAGKKAKKIKEYIGKEEKYQDMEKEDLKRMNIEDFSRDMMGIGMRDGENIYGAGYHNLEEVYKAGKERIVGSGVGEGPAERLMDILESIFHDIEIESDEITEKSEEEVSKEETLFEGSEVEEQEIKDELEIDQEQEEQVETEVVEEKKPTEEVEEKPPEKEEPSKEIPSTEELFGKENFGEVDKNEVEFKYWLPAILIPIILAIIGYLLFFF